MRVRAGYNHQKPKPIEVALRPVSKPLPKSPPPKQ
jgi:hypothetical protein